MAKTFRDWDVEQRWLLPPSVMDFVPADHISHFVRDTVREQLDLSAVLAPYEKEERGFPPYNPVMMTALLLYAYCQGVYSSRRIARGCEERMDFMAVTGLNRPDFRTVSDFRKRHLGALQGLFVQVLTLCQHAGLVKLGHVSLDGTKVKANASKHKANWTKRDLRPSIPSTGCQAGRGGARRSAVAGVQGGRHPTHLARRRQGDVLPRSFWRDDGCSDHR
jgi:transposase